jgi:hypothetical protein
MYTLSPFMRPQKARRQQMSDDPKDQMSASFRGTRDGRGFLKSLSTNIKGPAVSVVLVVWLGSVVALAIWGGAYAGVGFGLLSFFIAAYIGLLGRNSN